MGTFELIMSLMVAVVALVWVADRVHVPYPMLLMIGGLILAIVPFTPSVALEPEIVLVIFLPPILFQAAQTTSIRDFKANLGPISRLAVGLVIATTGLVAVVAHTVIPDISWPAAFVLGAVVSPPDAVAATAIFQRIGAPRQIVTILEGESLINDASAIVVYTFAVAAVVTGTFSLPEAILRFVLVVVIGVISGLAVGWLLIRIITLLGDASLEAIATLIAPVAAYVLAERLGGSGVLAVVAAGLFYGRASSRIQSPTSRIRGFAIWDVVIVAINGMVFILIGFELGELRKQLDPGQLGALLWHAFAVLIAMVVARFAYVFAGSLSRRHRGRRGIATEELDNRSHFLIAWSGLRGVVSLATALALPYMTDAGRAFDHRDEIILITAAVIVFTLFGFGLPLPWLVRRLQLGGDDSYEQELKLARHVVHQAMGASMEQFVRSDPKLATALNPILKQMKARADRMRTATETSTAEEIQQAMAPRLRARQAAISAAREALLELRDRGEIGDEVRREMERNLDLQELQLAA